MEINEGEYIRTIDGYIRKVTVVNKKGTYDAMCYGAYEVDIKYKTSVGISAKKVKAHSKNIIDLIEKGDIVKGKDNHLFEVYAVGSEYIYINNLEEFIHIEDIKSIITHEQMEAIEYRVE